METLTDIITQPMPFFSLTLALPEVFLTVAAMILLIAGVIKGHGFSRTVVQLSVITLIAACVLQVQLGHTEGTAFGGMFAINGFTAFTKLLLLLAGVVILLISNGFYKSDEEKRTSEFPVLVIFSLVGMMLMISANNFIALYMGLELQSLALYVLAAMHRDSLKSSEAGLKYFVLGALASGIFLYGCSLIYGFSGTVDFAVLANRFTAAEGTVAMPLGVLVGVVLVLVALCFKISAVPFHMWTPDVYEGAPTPVTAFFAVAPKVAAIALLIRLLLEPFGGVAAEWQQIIVFISAASMIVGAFGAIKQTNIKRLMAYSSIGHVGYMLIGLAVGKEQGVYSMLVYLSLYVTMSVGTFACIMMMVHRGGIIGKQEMSENIEDLAGLAKTYPLRALMIAIFMFSMSGIPPLAGFWGKMFIFQSAMKDGLYVLAVIGVLTSVVAAFYYLRIIKVMYFDEVRETFDKEISSELRFIAGATALFNVAFFLFPGPLFDAARMAAKALL